ncbi:hypothetical protein scyTo_0000690 [Scyliorhinus torazame]|uniref:Uncharacterized protein n=1 Tax=Scyliorhinus torazame TaxID=75743 RepID=A0A401P262_SCYTO|nr:hypothetical protein [Scyliorhinus torazame]
MQQLQKGVFEKRETCLDPENRKRTRKVSKNPISNICNIWILNSESFRVWMGRRDQGLEVALCEGQCCIECKEGLGEQRMRSPPQHLLVLKENMSAIMDRE